MDLPWILISVGFGVVILAILAILIFKKKGWKREVDYRNYFTMGMTWLPLGIVFSIIFESPIGYWFLIMGLIYFFIGLKNKDKWGKTQKMSPKYHKTLMISVLIGVIALVLGILVFELMI